MVPVERVPVGSVIVVRPGERLPLDGVVVGGDSSVDEAAMTGESMPVDKTAGDEVYAGTLNQFGALEVRTTQMPPRQRSAGSWSWSSRRRPRSPSERMVDRFARIYTPLVFAAALLVAVVPALLGG